jgi:hypothetical protein
MKTLSELLKENKSLIFSGFLFFLAGCFIISLYPQEGKFRYEFQKGGMWRHENLIAKYDFPIYKTSEVFENEKDSVISSFLPYFDFDEMLSAELIAELKFDFSEASKQAVKKDSLLLIGKSPKLKYYKDSLFKYGQLLENEVIKIYQKGIIENYNPAKNRTNIFVIKNKIGTEVSVSEFYTQNSAYALLRKAIAQKFRESNRFPDIDFHNYLKPNVTYDKEISDKILKEQIKKISHVHGMVQAGEHIINTGDLIDARKYIILLSLKKEYENSSGFLADLLNIFLGESLVIMSLLAIVFVFMFFFSPEILKGKRKTLFIVILPAFFVFATSISTHFHNIDIYLIPLVIIPLTISTFYDNQTAIVVHLLTVFVAGYMVPNGFEFSLIQFAAGLSAILSRRRVNHRSHYLKVSALVFVTYSVIYTGLVLTHEGSFSEIRLVKYSVFAINALLLLLTFPLLFFFEKVFGFISNITLLELSDTNRPLLRILAEKAPGTFQHSMQVANLAEEVVMQIGGNPLLVRVGAMYHDIGKTEAPAYFTENKHSSQNPHNLLEPDVSAEIILNHIKRGIEIAEKYNLPTEIIDFIKTHQGTGKVRWFLNAYKTEHPDAILDEKKFKYPGPIPFSKETAVLMMADSIEAASRSLKEFSEETISNLVEKIVEYQIKEKQFEEADITFPEINRAKEVFKQKLLNIYHTRIEYPKE